MALSRLTNWVANQILTRNALVAEFDNLYNNGLALISPLTGNLNAALRQITNLLLETQSATQSAGNEGRIYYQTALDEVHVDDGTNIRHVPTLTDPNADRITFWDDSAGAFAHLSPGTGLSITTTTLNAAVLETGTWSDASGSRVIDTIYQNTSGKKRRVIVSINGLTVNTTVTAKTGAANPPTLVTAVYGTAQSTASAEIHALAFEVPASYFYQVLKSGAAANVTAWVECDE